MHLSNGQSHDFRMQPEDTNANTSKLRPTAALSLRRKRNRSQPHLSANRLERLRACCAGRRHPREPHDDAVIHGEASSDSSTSSQKSSAPKSSRNVVLGEDTERTPWRKSVKIARSLKNGREGTHHPT